MQGFLDLFIFINCSTCFRRFLRPSSGAQNCTYSIGYCQSNTAASCYSGWDGTEYSQQDATFSPSIYFYKLLYMFQGVPPPIIRSTKLYIQRQVLSNQYCCLLQYWFDNTWPCMHSFVLWWWAEERPETCRVFYGNKQLEKTYFIGCTLEIHLRCTDIWTSH